MPPAFGSVSVDCIVKANQNPTSGDLVARYFERVLGVRGVGREMAETIKFASPANQVEAAGVCLLIEVGAASDTPSIQQMGSRLVEAIRNEWLKKSIDNMPEIEWLRVEDGSWADAVSDYGTKAVLAIVCGAGHAPVADERVLHVSSFAEMQASHVLKRDSWRAMQQRISAV